MTDRFPPQSRAYAVLMDSLAIGTGLLATWLGWRMLSRFPFAGSPAAEAALYVLMVVSGFCLSPIALVLRARLPQGVLEGKSTLQLLLEPRPQDAASERVWWWGRLGGSAAIVSVLAALFLAVLS